MLFGKLLGLFWVPIYALIIVGNIIPGVILFYMVGKKFYTVGLAAIAWAIWNDRNRANLRVQNDEDPFRDFLLCLLFFIYWACLQKEGDAKVLRTGVELLRSNTTNLMRICEAAQRPIEGE